MENDWSKLAAIAPPNKWLQMYSDYQDLLLREDVAGWWAGEYNIANKERNELKELVSNLIEQRDNRDKTIEKLIGWLEKSNISPLDYQT